MGLLVILVSTNDIFSIEFESLKTFDSDDCNLDNSDKSFFENSSETSNETKMVETKKGDEI
jgi:hypothetical protein